MANFNYPKPLEPVMIFIDGGYLRRLFVDLFGDDKIDFNSLRGDLVSFYSKIWSHPFRANLIRTYYYDGITDEKEKEYAKQRKYFDTMKEKYEGLDIYLGEAVKLPDGTFRQKGVDILMAIDVLTMAYQDHFDSGLFLLGDRDFIPLIEAVKGSGKKTFLVSYVEKVPKELAQAFDFRVSIDKWYLRRSASREKRRSCLRLGINENYVSGWLSCVWLRFIVVLQRGFEENRDVMVLLFSFLEELYSFYCCDVLEPWFYQFHGFFGGCCPCARTSVVVEVQQVHTSLSSLEVIVPARYYYTC